MVLGMLAINLNYDIKYDILYARVSNYSPSYGDENNGIVTFYSISTDEISGMAIYNAKKRIQCGDLALVTLPIPIDLNSVQVQTLLNRPEKGSWCTLQLS